MHGMDLLVVLILTARSIQINPKTVSPVTDQWIIQHVSESPAVPDFKYLNQEFCFRYRCKRTTTFEF